MNAPGEVSIYPGMYEPPVWLDEVLNSERNKDSQLINLTVNIVELPEYYKIEMPVPGFSRGDIFVGMQGGWLTISCMHKENQCNIKSHSDSECIKKKIKLPKDVDGDFVTAEFREGVLFIFIFKSFCENRPHAVRIVVY